MADLALLVSGILLVLILLPVISIAFAYVGKPWAIVVSKVSGILGVIAGTWFWTIDASDNSKIFGIVVIAASAIGMGNASKRKNH
jgi:hypothetical protein